MPILRNLSQSSARPLIIARMHCSTGRGEINLGKYFAEGDERPCQPDTSVIAKVDTSGNTNVACSFNLYHLLAENSSSSSSTQFIYTTTVIINNVIVREMRATGQEIRDCESFIVTPVLKIVPDHGTYTVEIEEQRIRTINDNGRDVPASTIYRIIFSYSLYTAKKMQEWSPVHPGYRHDHIANLAWRLWIKEMHQRQVKPLPKFRQSGVRIQSPEREASCSSTATQSLLDRLGGFANPSRRSIDRLESEEHAASSSSPLLLLCERSSPAKAVGEDVDKVRSNIEASSDQEELPFRTKIKLPAIMPSCSEAKEVCLSPDYRRASCVIKEEELADIEGEQDDLDCPSNEARSAEPASLDTNAADISVESVGLYNTNRVEASQMSPVAGKQTQQREQIIQSNSPLLTSIAVQTDGERILEVASTFLQQTRSTVAAREALRASNEDDTRSNSINRRQTPMDDENELLKKKIRESTAKRQKFDTDCLLKQVEQEELKARIAEVRLLKLNKTNAELQQTLDRVEARIKSSFAPSSIVIHPSLSYHQYPLDSSSPTQHLGRGVFYQSEVPQSPYYTQSPTQQAPPRLDQGPSSSTSVPGTRLPPPLMLQGRKNNDSHTRYRSAAHPSI